MTEVEVPLEQVEEEDQVAPDRPILLVCHRYHLQVTIESQLELQEANHVWEQDGIVIREFKWKSIERLCIVSGVNHVSPSDTVSTIIDISSCDSFLGGKVIFVCQNSTKRYMTDEARVVFPRAWDVCVTADELEQALGEPLTEEQKRVLEQRHLPRPLQNVLPRREQHRRRHRRIIEEQQQQRQPHGGQMINLQDMLNMWAARQQHRVRNRLRVRAIGPGGVIRIVDDELAEATRLSLEAYERELEGADRPNIRDEPRNENPWDAVFKDVVVIQDNAPQDHICCVCTENYATIKTIDAAATCDHIVMCDACAKIIMDTTKRCPICRAEPMTVRRETIYLPATVEEEKEEEEPPLKKAKK